MSSYATASTASLEREHSRKSSHRLAILLATVAAFLLVPVANAAAANNFELGIVGTGSGTIVSGPPGTGTPAINCTYTAPGPATGTCKNEMEPLGFLPGKVGIGLQATPVAGSVVDHWIVSEGEIFAACGPGEAGCFITADEGENAKATAVFCLTGEPSCSGTLTLFVNGAGTVTSSPGTINCEAGEECSQIFTAGPVALTAAPEPGYVIAGWIGCKQLAGEPTVCTAEMDEDRQVTAIFLKEGTEGEPGEDGTNGTNGTNGANGANGAQGPAGATGPAGPAGKVKVTCKMKGKTKVKCTVKSQASSSRLAWRVTHGGHTVSHGRTSTARLQQVLNGLPDGNYSLRVKGQRPVRISIG